MDSKHQDAVQYNGMAKCWMEAVWTYIHELVAVEILKQITVTGSTPAVEHIGPEFRKPWIPRIRTQTKTSEMVFKLRNFTSFGLKNY